MGRIDELVEALKATKPAEDPAPPETFVAPKRERGRHLSLTEALERAICNYLSSSNCTPVIAARCAGVPGSRFYRWMRLGHAKPQSRHGRFVAAILEAQAKQAWRRTAGLLKVAKDVQATALTNAEKIAGARLELDIHRATQKEFQPRERVSFNGKLKVEAQHSISKWTQAELADELERRALKARKRATIEGTAKVLESATIEPESKDGEKE